MGIAKKGKSNDESNVGRTVLLPVSVLSSGTYTFKVALCGGVIVEVSAYYFQEALRAGTDWICEWSDDGTIDQLKELKESDKRNK